MAIRIRFEKYANGKNAKKAKNGVSRGPSPRSGRRSARKPMGFARNGSLVWVLGGLLALLLALLMTAGVAPTTTGYREGDIALIDIKAPQDMRVEDGAATADLRRKAREGVRARYDIDSELQKSIESRSAAAFAAVRKEIASRSEVARKKAQQGEVARRGGRRLGGFPDLSGGGGVAGVSGRGKRLRRRVRGKSRPKDLGLAEAGAIRRLDPE